MTTAPLDPFEVFENWLREVDLYDVFMATDSLDLINKIVAQYGARQEATP